MTRSRLFALFLVITVSLISLYFIRVNAQTEEVTVVERHTVVTPVPTAKEILNIPTGYVNCFNVEAGWHGDLWIPTHRVCQYENMAEGVAWVEGYWACNKAADDGTCTSWQWKAGHWEQTLAVY